MVFCNYHKYYTIFWVTPEDLNKIAWIVSENQYVKFEDEAQFSMSKLNLQQCLTTFNFKMTISSTLYAFTWSFLGKKVLQYQKEHFLITMIVEWKEEIVILKLQKKNQREVIQIWKK
jgi:hypothetical protein